MTKNIVPLLCFDGLYVFFFRYGGFDFGMPLPSDLQMDLQGVPKNRTLSKVSLSSASPLPVSLSL